METTVEKAMIIALKNDIKKAVEEQKYLKKVRKEAKLTYDQSNARPIWTPMHPSIAQSKAYFNGRTLRIKYAAYGLMREKTFSQIENHYPEENHPLNHQFKNEIAKIKEKYFMTVMEAVEK